MSKLKLKCRICTDVQYRKQNAEIDPRWFYCKTCRAYSFAIDTEGLVPERIEYNEYDEVRQDVEDMFTGYSEWNHEHMYELEAIAASFNVGGFGVTKGFVMNTPRYWEPKGTPPPRRVIPKVQIPELRVLKPAPVYLVRKPALPKLKFA